MAVEILTEQKAKYFDDKDDNDDTLQLPQPKHKEKLRNFLHSNQH